MKESDNNNNIKKYENWDGKHHVAISDSILKKRINALLGSHSEDREEMKKELHDAIKPIFEKHGIKIFE